MKIVHVFRAPIGGLFRHVCDLARGQSELGHEVGIVCDSTTGGDYAQGLLDALKPYCKLGIERRPISRLPGLGDVNGARAVIDVANMWKPDVLHGHGSKGGAYGRLAAYRLGAKSFYTPHGGSLHYPASWPMRQVFRGVEVTLRNMGTGLCFVCNYEKQRYDKMIGIKGKPSIVVYNGLWDEEFFRAEAAPAATDFLFLGEMRDYKGVDILLRALAGFERATLTLVGDGPAMQEYKDLAASLGLTERCRFTGRLPMLEAMKLGHIMVLPSRFESFPYVVLETAAAGLPLITSAVGGIPEVVPKQFICDPLTPEALMQHMRTLLESADAREQGGKTYADHIRKTCSAVEMTKRITDFYASAR
jgi:glycosyltransferase involved in cell wall biosynthesis